MREQPFLIPARHIPMSRALSVTSRRAEPSIAGDVWLRGIAGASERDARGRDRTPETN